MTLVSWIEYLENAFCKTAYNFDAKFQFSVKDDVKYVGLVKLFIPEAFRKKTYGHDFMNFFTEVLDMYNYGAKTIASEEYGISLESLIRFYGTHGFKAVGDEFVAGGFRQRLLERTPR